MFRAEGVPIYGHVGVRFDARSAQLVQVSSLAHSPSSTEEDAKILTREPQQMRDRRFKDTFDKILLRCVKQIQDDVQMQRKSSVFVVPDSLHGDLTPYNVRDVMEYLLVALREDRGYTVVQVCMRSTLPLFSISRCAAG